MKKSKTAAYSRFYRIADGHENGISRPKDQREDRILRSMIEQANHNGDCIIHGKTGYYRPVPGDSVDRIEYRAYIMQEKSRYRKIKDKTLCMAVAYRCRETEFGL